MQSPQVHLLHSIFVSLSDVPSHLAHDAERSLAPTTEKLFGPAFSFISLVSWELGKARCSPLLVHHMDWHVRVKL
ncbi:hypothetical protein Pmani_004203 [Petrolisthes manimaculis]|uniref:Uncharacterized protein n=1 Tax=Petrolisthes manimaculis TaxID=1843537 RepID=A0AAE1QET7_9EUCA|nr:hypothetical protein Pmani_004203 [Petrolisthes manimaculis]